MSDIEFVPGLIVKLPPENAPDYIIGKLSINIDALKDWLSDRDGDWVNVELKIARSGKPYAAVDNWRPSSAPAAPQQKPAAKPAPAKAAASDWDDSDVPF